MSKEREALAEPKQEPVAWVNRDELDNMLDDQTAIVTGKKDGFRKTPLYTAPPARKPLTDEQLRTLARDAGIKLMNDEALSLGYLPAAIKKFAKAIERAHGINE